MLFHTTRLRPSKGETPVWQARSSSRTLERAPRSACLHTAATRRPPRSHQTATMSAPCPF